MNEPEVFLEHENVTITLQRDKFKVIAKCKDSATLDRVLGAYHFQFGHSKVWVNKGGLEVKVQVKTAEEYEYILMCLEAAKQILMLSEPERIKQ